MGIFERAWEVTKMVIESEQPRRCKYCGSYHVVRFGRSNQVQRFLCRDCGKTFMDTDALPGMKTPAIQVSSALSMYYGGMSLNGIRRHLDQQYNNRPSDSTVYEWLERFTKKAIREAREYTPKVGNVWVADETAVKVGGKKFWLIDIIDNDTRFLLASRLSLTRQKKDIALLLRKAYLKADKAPDRVITDGLKVYPDAVDLVFGGDTRHVVSTPFVEKDSTNVIERFQCSLKDRTKVMRGLKKQETAVMLLEGWLVHYNYFRPHESLNDHTPAEKAGIKFPFKDWLDVVSRPKVTVGITPAKASPLVSPSRGAGMPSARIKPLSPKRGDYYEGRGMISRRPFKGGRARRGRII